MKKSVMRVLALAICLVMVLAMVPAKARAVELDKNSMPLLESINVDSWGEYYFTIFISFFYPFTNHPTFKLSC